MKTSATPKIGRVGLDDEEDVPPGANPGGYEITSFQGCTTVKYMVERVDVGEEFASPATDVELTKTYAAGTSSTIDALKAGLYRIVARAFEESCFMSAPAVHRFIVLKLPAVTTSREDNYVVLTNNARAEEHGETKVCVVDICRFNSLHAAQPHPSPSPAQPSSTARAH